MTDEKLQNNLLIPLTIVIAGLIISLSIVIGGEPQLPKKLEAKDVPAEKIIKNQPAVTPTQENGRLENVQPVSVDDHIIGSSDSPVKIIEFSDLECPFCKSFHPTMKKIAAEYQDKVAWVYRHFPLDSIHSKARKEAEAAECAAELGGNGKFWSYIEKLFEVTPSNNGLNLEELPNIASNIGLSRQEFETCLQSGRYTAKIAAQLQDAKNSGGRGTPYSIVIAKDGRRIPINGAVSYEEIRTVIEDALR